MSYSSLYLVRPARDLKCHLLVNRVKYFEGELVVNKVKKGLVWFIITKYFWYVILRAYFINNSTRPRGLFYKHL